MSDRCVGDTERCLRCGHEGHPEDGEFDSHGDWLCEICMDTAPESETPIVTDGGWPEGDPCPDCGELMDVGAVGNPGETITWQDCEDCGIGWGPFTGFVPLDEDETGAPLSTDTDRSEADR